MTDHNSSEHDWEACQECVDQAIEDGILSEGDTPREPAPIRYRVQQIYADTDPTSIQSVEILSRDLNPVELADKLGIPLLVTDGDKIVGVITSGEITGLPTFYAR